MKVKHMFQMALKTQRNNSDSQFFFLASTKAGKIHPYRSPFVEIAAREADFSVIDRHFLQAATDRAIQPYSGVDYE